MPRDTQVDFHPESRDHLRRTLLALAARGFKRVRHNHKLLRQFTFRINPPPTRLPPLQWAEPESLDMEDDFDG